MNIDNQIEYLKSIAVAGCNAGIKSQSCFHNGLYGSWEDE